MCDSAEELTEILLALGELSTSNIIGSKARDDTVDYQKSIFIADE
jgi:hypothetical protein